MTRLLKNIFLLLGLLLISCVKLNPEPSPILPKEERQVTFEFSVTYAGGQSQQTWTKALGEKPDITSLHLAVFNEAHYLESYSEATDLGIVTDNGIVNKKSYSVTLPVIDEPVTIHLIANGPEELRFGDETSLIASLYTTSNQDAYWQVVDLPEGITTEGSSVSPSVVNALSNVSLIRNFARLSVSTSAESNLTLIGAYVVNNCDRGSIAVYNTNSGGFVNNYKEFSNTSELIASGYSGFIPSGRQLFSELPTEEDFIPANENGIVYDYVYERELPTESPMYVLIKAYFRDDDFPTYYKISLTDAANGQYFPILRNFNYTINIKKAENRGSLSIEQAAQSSGTGDVSTSLDNEELTNISNGESRIFVSYTDTTVVNTNVIQLKYKFVPNINDGSVPVANGQVADSYGNYTDIHLSELPEGQQAIASWEIGQTDDNEGFRTIYITPTQGTSIVKVQSFIIIGHAEMGEGRTPITIQRRVNIIVREELRAVVACDPDEVPNVKGSPVDVYLRIPNELPKMIFPLQFSLEAEKLSLTPHNDNLPIITGLSIIPQKQAAHQTSFKYLREISWDEYREASVSTIGGNAYRSFVSHFKTNMASSATRVYAANQYFTTTFGEFINYNGAAYQFSNLSFDKNVLHFSEETRFSFGISDPSFLNNNNENIAVLLSGFEPADNETSLQYIGLNENGLAEYSYVPEDPYRYTGNEFSLSATSVEGTGSVSLKARRYDRAEATVAIEKSIFINPTIAKPNGNYIGATTTLSFSLEQKPQTISIRLVGLEPANGTNLEYDSANDCYIYRPSSVGPQSINLKTTFARGQVSASLSAYAFENSTVVRRLSKKIRIAENALTYTNNNRRYVFGSLYNTSINGKYVYICESDNLEITNESPKALINRTENYYYIFSTYTFKNKAYSEFEVYEDTNILYFLFPENNNTTWVGTLDISSLNGDVINITSNTSINKTITFSRR